MLRVDKTDIPILIYLWECKEAERNPLTVSEKLNLSYTYVCSRASILIKRGAIKRINIGRTGYYTKPLRGFMYEVMRQTTGLSMRKSITKFNETWSAEEG